MKAHAVIKTFKDGNKQAVAFTERDDALDAFNGCESGSSLAVEWSNLYGGKDGCPKWTPYEDQDLYPDFEEHESVEIKEIDL